MSPPRNVVYSAGVSPFAGLAERGGTTGLDAIEALGAAAVAQVDDDVLAVGPLKRADGRHHPAAAAQPVARLHGIHMA